MKKFSALLLFSFLLNGCNPVGMQSGGGSTKKNTTTGLSPSSLEYGYGFALPTDPISMTNNTNITENENFNRYIPRNGYFITSNSLLTETCTITDNITTSTISNCFSVSNTQTSTPTTPKNGKWPYTYGTKEFLDVHTFYHLKKAVTHYNSSIGFGVYQSRFLSNPSSLPNTVGNDVISNKSHWDAVKTLQVYSNCSDVGANSVYSPSTNEICMGYDPASPNLKAVLDPAMIYHELGHALVKNMLNLRNRMSTATTLSSDMGIPGGASEAFGINEGLSDYFSYINNQLTHFSKWYAGMFTASRPMVEDDPQHSNLLSLTSEGRLSYPEFVNYDSNASTYNYKHCYINSENVLTCPEDEHMSGQIVSHYLVALTKDLMTTCFFNHENATKYITYLLAETLAEVGDLKGYGKNSTATFDSFSNLMSGSESNAYDWSHIVNPVNFRRFFQTFGRNLIKVMTDSTVCSSYTQNQSEKLLDDYGLLLFKTYNDNGNDDTLGRIPASSVTLTQVSNANRVKSVLVSKSQIGLPPTNSGLSEAYVIDTQSSVLSQLQSMTYQGNVVQLSPLTPADLRYNNGNAKISPGEVVGLALNLYNSSNSTIGGAQVLANDWDHAEQSSGKLKACRFTDGWPIESEGAAASTAETTSCSTQTTNNSETAPVCYVQVRNTNETKWVSQKEYKTLNSDFPCLDDSNSSNCLLRVIPSRSYANYSKIDPLKTWGQSMVAGISGAQPIFKSGNLLFFEVNKWIPPGTSFNCRFRVRFSNCSDCYHDPDATDNDDYRDYEYSGYKPFKIINFKFQVVD